MLTAVSYFQSRSDSRIVVVVGSLAVEAAGFGGLAGFAAAARDNDHGRPQAAVVDQIAGLENLQHGAVRHVGIFLLHHGLMVMRVERLACRIDGLDAVTLKRAAEIALRQHDTFEQRLQGRIGIDRVFGHSRNGALEIVADRQNVLGELGDRVFRRFFFFLLKPAADVFGFGNRAHELIMLVGDSRGFGVEIGLQRCDDVLQLVNAKFRLASAAADAGAQSGFAASASSGFLSSLIGLSNSFTISDGSCRQRVIWRGRTAYRLAGPKIKPLHRRMAFAALDLAAR